MRDSKTLFLMILALALATSSFVLISIWGYHYYFQTKNEPPAAKQTEKKAQQILPNVPKDSTYRFADSVVSLPDSLFQSGETNYSDSLGKTLELKLIEYKKIQQEIEEIVKKKEILKNKVNEAKKINDLQKNIDSLKRKKEEMIKENEKMSQILTQKEPPQNVSVKTGNSKARKIVQPAALPLLVSHLNFVAIDGKRGYEKQTMLASEATKFEGSFEISIDPKMEDGTEIFVKILQPNGRPLLNARSGFSILQSDSGKSAYSLVLHFDKNRDDHKRLGFSFESAVFQKGRYTMQIYHNGVMIGRMQRTLL